jgi:hypothetical protein
MEETSSLDYKGLRYELKDEVAAITLDRPWGFHYAYSRIALSPAYCVCY